MAQNVVGVCRENGHYLAVDGEPVFPVGATHLHGWTAISRPDHDYARDLDRLAEVIDQADSPHVKGMARIASYFPLSGGLQPWDRGSDGLYRLGYFNPQWDSRLEDYLELALQRGIVVSLEVWDDWSVTRGPGGAYNPGEDSGWGAHPFNPRNNSEYGDDVLPAATRRVNAPFYLTVPERADNRPVLELQQLYVDHLCRVAGGYPHVLWNISNESRAPLAWSRYWAAYLQEKLPDERLVGDMPSTNRQDGRGECDPELNPRSLIVEPDYDYVDISQAVSRHAFGEDPLEQALCAGDRIEGYRVEMDEYGHQKPLVVSKDYTNSDPDGVAVLWAKFVGGAATGRFHRPTHAEQAGKLADFQFEAVRRLGRMIGRTQFWRMRPNHDLIRNLPEEAGALVLEEPGRQYVIQIVGGREAEFDMLIEPGEYRLSWYDPRRDRWLKEDLAVVSESGFGNHLETPPHRGDLIGHLRRD
ncbi:MAG: hypothetical protein ACOC7T_00995 [Planctomycetota bacterium]